MQNLPCEQLLSTLAFAAFFDCVRADRMDASKALARVADTAASTSGGGVRASSAEERAKLGAVIAATEDAERARQESDAAREAALRQVKLSKPDAEFLAAQFEMPLPLAERSLRLHGGDINKALAALLGTSTTSTSV